MVKTHTREKKNPPFAPKIAAERLQMAATNLRLEIEGNADYLYLCYCRQVIRLPVVWYGVCGTAWCGALSCPVPTVVPCLSYITVSRGIPDAALEY